MIYIGSALLIVLLLMIMAGFLPDRDRQASKEMRHKVAKTFPDQAARVIESFGLFPYTGSAAEGTSMAPSSAAVVLIHGLDDPGKVWMNLAPELTGRGYAVWQMFYPNDQAIVDSALYFFDALKGLQENGITRITIISHSMGGLVSREMLTSPLIDYRDKVRKKEVPRVENLVMVGTPNHGSEMVRFRLFGEIRDQWVNMVKGKGNVLRGILDGVGEAKADLLPESQFLEILNSRPNPEGVQLFIIAGVVSPWNEGEVKQLIDTMAEKTGNNLEMLADLESFLKSMSNGLGDGLVTVESTKLEGVDHTTVHGTHLSMIRNIMEGDNRIPPAIPVITEFMERHPPPPAE